LKHSLPSLPPMMIMTLPITFAVWYPRAVGASPASATISQRSRAGSASRPTSKVHTSFTASVPFPPPKTQRRPSKSSAVCARRGAGTSAPGGKTARVQRRSTVSSTKTSE
jgi:hypothetical protein